MRREDILDINCCDLDLTYAQEVDLVRRAMSIIKQKTYRLAVRDEIAIACALDAYVEGNEDLRRDEQEELDAIEDRLGIMAVWIDPENVWIRRGGSSDCRDDWNVEPVSLN